MAYNIELYRQPNTLNFSKNPIIFGFSVHPFNESNIISRHRIFVTIQFSFNIENPLFEDLWTGTVGPDHNGYCTLDVSSVLDAKLAFFTPNPNIVKFFKCAGQNGIFKLHYYLADNTSIISAQSTSTFYHVYKGGIAKEDVDNNATYLNDTVYTNRTPLHFFTPNEALRIGQPKYLFFIYKYAASVQATNVNLGITYHLLAGSSSYYDAITQAIQLEQYQLYCVPIDIISINLQASAASDFDLIKYFEVQIQDQNIEDLVFLNSNIIRFEIDKRAYYEPMYLLYRNSVGALESQCVLGDKEFSANIAGQQTESVLLSDLMGDVLINREQFDTKNMINNLIKANTGWLSKPALLRLRDMLLNKQVWQVYGKRLKPVYIAARNTALHSQSDSLYSLSLDIANAYEDENTSPEALIAFSDICPAVDFVWGGCNQGGFIWVKWKLPAGYDRIQFYYTVDIIPATVFEITYTGNTGTANIDINSASNFAIIDFQVTLKARVICNDEVSPYSYGPYTSDLIIDGASLMPPIANDDVADEGPRNLAPRLLNSGGFFLNILANDIAANGAQLEFDNAYNALGTIATGTSANGAFVSVTPAGEIFYFPTSLSIAITLEDVIYYKCQENVLSYGYIQSNLAKIRVPLEAQTPPIFVKRQFFNHQEVAHKYGFLNQYKLFDKIADVYIQFFKDAACTIPVDVTGLGVSIAYYLEINDTPYSYFGVAGSTTPSTSGITVVGCSGTSMLLLPNFYYWKYSAAGGFNQRTQNPRGTLAGATLVTGYIGW